MYFLQVALICLIKFYKHIYNLDKHTRPQNLTWFEQSNKRTKQRIRDPKRRWELIITPEEFKTIIEYYNDINGRNKALFETYQGFC